ncbi:hypothetical protein DFH09DRAFT_1100736 [Mycena vulgaris]|nr:hypothetical protein DFH09DRAFT_1100736 [Mycena vulgaris]
MNNFATSLEEYTNPDKIALKDANLEAQKDMCLSFRDRMENSDDSDDETRPPVTYGIWLASFYSLAQAIYLRLNLVFDCAAYGTVLGAPVIVVPGRHAEFPIYCPTCIKPGEQRISISDVTAQQVLGEPNIEECNHAKLLSTLNLMQCYEDAMETDPTVTVLPWEDSSGSNFDAEYTELAILNGNGAVGEKKPETFVIYSPPDDRPETPVDSFTTHNLTCVQANFSTGGCLMSIHEPAEAASWIHYNWNGPLLHPKQQLRYNEVVVVNMAQTRLAHSSGFPVVIRPTSDNPALTLLCMPFALSRINGDTEIPIDLGDLTQPLSRSEVIALVDFEIETRPRATQARKVFFSPPPRFHPRTTRASQCGGRHFAGCSSQYDVCARWGPELCNLIRVVLLLIATYWLDLPLFPASGALLGLTHNPLRKTLPGALVSSVYKHSYVHFGHSRSCGLAMWITKSWFWVEQRSESGVPQAHQVIRRHHSREKLLYWEHIPPLESQKLSMRCPGTRRNPGPVN